MWSPEAIDLAAEAAELLDDDDDDVPAEASDDDDGGDDEETEEEKLLWSPVADEWMLMQFSSTVKFTTASSSCFSSRRGALTRRGELGTRDGALGEEVEVVEEVELAELCGPHAVSKRLGAWS